MGALFYRLAIQTPRGEFKTAVGADMTVAEIIQHATKCMDLSTGDIAELYKGDHRLADDAPISDYLGAYTKEDWIKLELVMTGRSV